MGQRDTWDRTSRNEIMISTSLQKPSRISLLTLSCFIAVCATHEEPRLAYHRHKSQSFGIASAGYVLRSTCCHFEEPREDKARIPSPVLIQKAQRESTSCHVYWCGGLVGLPGRIQVLCSRMPSLHGSPKCGTAWKLKSSYPIYAQQDSNSTQERQFVILLLMPQVLSGR